MQQGQIERGTEQDYILAGKATFTVQNEETTVRFTFKVTKAKPRYGQSQEQAPWFVKVLTGSDNENSYSYLGVIWPDRNYCHGRKSRISQEAQSARAFSWIWSKLTRDCLPDQVKVYHEGRCGRCGRKLTVPESVRSGYGPECSQILGLTR